MPFTCRYCGQPYCSTHRLPENHDCRGLEDYKEQLRDRGQLIAETPEVKVQREIHEEGKEPGRRVRTRATTGLSGLFQRLEGRVTWALLAVMGLVTVGGWLTAWAVTGGWLSSSAFGEFYTTYFALSTDSWRLPWTIATSVFAHGGIGHLLINGMVLFFFGPALERRVGSRTFLWFFLITGIVAGVAQMMLGVGLYGVAGTPAVLGASGAIMGILGALTLLAPDAKVLLFFMIPLPLWLITAGYAVWDIAGLVLQSGNVAHLAHLTGLAIGLYIAHRYWRRTPGRQFETYTV